MKAYVLTTGAVFALITIAHIWRFIEEGSRLATEPVYIVLTLAAATLALWAASLIYRWPRS